MSPSATPASQSAAASPATNRAQARPSAPPDPTQCRKCHACHAKRRKMSPSATPATGNKGGCRQVPHPAAQSAAASPATKCAQAGQRAVPATQNEGRCRRVPRLPRKVPRRHRQLSAPKRAQACHQIQPSAASATKATQSGAARWCVKDGV